MTKEEISSVLGHEPLTFEQMKETEAMYLQHDWEALRNQAAIAAMQGVICAQRSTNNWDINKLANVSVRIADKLIEELKKK